MEGPALSKDKAALPLLHVIQQEQQQCAQPFGFPTESWLLIEALQRIKSPGRSFQLGGLSRWGRTRRGPRMGRCHLPYEASRTADCTGPGVSLGSMTARCTRIGKKLVAGVEGKLMKCEKDRGRQLGLLNRVWTPQYCGSGTPVRGLAGNRGTRVRPTKA